LLNRKYLIVFLLLLVIFVEIKAIDIDQFVGYIIRSNYFSDIENNYNYYISNLKLTKDSNFPLKYNGVINSAGAKINSWYISAILTLYDGGVAQREIKRAELQLEQSIQQAVLDGRSRIEFVVNQLIQYNYLSKQMDLISNLSAMFPDQFNYEIELKKVSLSLKKLEKQLAEIDVDITNISYFEWPKIPTYSEVILLINEKPQINPNYTINKLTTQSNNLYINANNNSNVSLELTKSKDETKVSLNIDSKLVLGKNTLRFHGRTDTSKLEPITNISLNSDSVINRFISIDEYNNDSYINELVYILEYREILNEELKYKSEILNEVANDPCLYNVWVETTKDIMAIESSIDSLNIKLLLKIGYYDDYVKKSLGF